LVLGCLFREGKGCSGKENNLPLITSEPTLVATHSHGKLFSIDAIQPSLKVLHVYGTPYQMGKAHGELLKETIQQLMAEVTQFADTLLVEQITYLPKWLADLIAKYGVNAALDITYYLTKPFTPTYFLEELQGLSTGAGIPYMEATRLHMIPELIQASCSMLGAWGPAIKGTNGTLFQLRALDWITNGPFQKYPQLLVYHPEDGHNFTVLGWAGFIGALTGFSSAPMGLSQKLWYNYNGTMNREGIPFHYLLRDILQFDSDIDSAITRIANAERTCSIFIGLGDYSNRFKIIEYSYQHVEVWDDHNFPAYKGHPLLAGAVYIDKHPQPSHDPCLGSLMQKFYGNLDANTIFRSVTALLQTGDTHIAVYDFQNMLIYVSNASPYVQKKFVPAYDRAFVRLDLSKLFAQSI